METDNPHCFLLQKKCAYLNRLLFNLCISLFSACVNWNLPVVVVAFIVEGWPLHQVAVWCQCSPVLASICDFSLIPISMICKVYRTNIESLELHLPSVILGNKITVFFFIAISLFFTLWALDFSKASARSSLSSFRHWGDSKVRHPATRYSSEITAHWSLLGSSVEE